MSQQSISERRFCVLSGLCGMAGVLMLGTSFAFAIFPGPGTSQLEMAEYAQQHANSVLFGAWLQAVGPVFIMLFAFALVRLAGAMAALAGWMTLFGATVLTTVSLIEVTFYIAALFPEPRSMMLISLNAIFAVQHLYFIVAAPALFLPLGMILLGSRALPRLFGHSAIILATIFFVLGLVFLDKLILPAWVTAFASVQALWWLGAAFTVMIRGGRAAH